MRSVPLVSRPFDLDRLTVVRKALEQQKLKTDLDILSEGVEDRYRLILGESPKMQLAVAMVREAHPTRNFVYFGLRGEKFWF